MLCLKIKKSLTNPVSLEINGRCADPSSIFYYCGNSQLGLMSISHLAPSHLCSPIGHGPHHFLSDYPKVHHFFFILCMETLFLWPRWNTRNKIYFTTRNNQSGHIKYQFSRHWTPYNDRQEAKVRSPVIVHCFESLQATVQGAGNSGSLCGQLGGGAESPAV